VNSLVVSVQIEDTASN